MTEKERKADQALFEETRQICIKVLQDLTYIEVDNLKLPQFLLITTIGVPSNKTSIELEMSGRLTDGYLIACTEYIHKLLDNRRKSSIDDLIDKLLTKPGKKDPDTELPKTPDKID